LSLHLRTALGRHQPQPPLPAGSHCAPRVERHFQHSLRRRAAELNDAGCPRILGIDEHFFSRRHGYATTFCDLAKHKVYGIVLGRSEAALGRYLHQLKGKEKVRVISMDLFTAIVRALTGIRSR
jgi:transposase